MLKSTIENLARDDHACYDFKDGSFITFGGFVNGSRVDHVIRFKQEGATLTANQIAGAELANDKGPCHRASLSMGVYDNKIFVFGG